MRAPCGRSARTGTVSCVSTGLHLEGTGCMQLRLIHDATARQLSPDIANNSLCDHRLDLTRTRLTQHQNTIIATIQTLASTSENSYFVFGRVGICCVRGFSSFNLNKDI